MKPLPNLSKSKFVAGWQCLKRLYLQVYQRELAAEIDEATQAILTQGQEVGLLAQKAFPDGVLVEAGHLEIEKALAETQRLMANSSIPALFEAAFLYDNVLVRVDILQRCPRNRWRLIEAKSSTGVKEYHFYDLAIQKHVLIGSGIKLHSSCLMYLNRDYVFDGKEYLLDKLFVTEELDDEIEEHIPEVPQLLAEMRKTLSNNSPPDINPGPQCSDPFVCEFFDHCNAPFPLDHVGNLPGLIGRKLAQLLDNGITVISDIPDDFPLDERQQRARESVIEGKPWINSAIQEELGDLIYPLYFMDFETINPALPRFKGMRPYDQIPFQWSVHIQKKPGGELEHHEFLAEDERDPRPEFLESLIEVLKDQPTFPSPLAGEGGPSADGPGEGFQISTPLSGGDRKLAEHSGVGVLSDSPPFQKTQPRSAAGKKSGQECQGSIVVYNRSFESGRLNDLARWLSSPSLVKEGARGRWSPALVQKYRAQIENIQARLWDLLPFIRDNIYHPNFHGSFSIKSVLPALIPDMTYEGMLIGDGKQAGLAWEKMVRGGIPIAEKKRVRDGLLAYCRQDTLAMVELLNVIRFRINR